MKKIADSITVIVFFLILVMFAVSAIFFQNAYNLKPEVGENDNTKVSTSQFLRNSFPLKSNLKALYANVMTLVGKTHFDNIYIIDGRLIEVNNLNEEKIKNNTKLLNDFSKRTDIPMYTLIAPTSAGIYFPELSEGSDRVSQKSYINDVYFSLDNKIASIDAFSALYSSREEYIYYRTDSSWTSMGAYYAYLETAKKMGYEPKYMVNYDLEYAENNFRGDLHSKIYYNKIAADRINLFRSKYKSDVESVTLSNGNKSAEAKSVYFKSALKTSDKNDVFLEGDNFERITITTSNKDAPKLLILKGSFANSLAVLLVPHFSEITLVDLELIQQNNKKINDIVTLSDYRQILTVMDIEEFSNTTGFNALKQ